MSLKTRMILCNLYRMILCIWRGLSGINGAAQVESNRYKSELLTLTLAAADKYNSRNSRLLTNFILVVISNAKERVT